MTTDFQLESERGLTAGSRLGGVSGYISEAHQWDNSRAGASQTYSVIYADPPWDYGCKAPTESPRPCLERGEHPGNVNHYYQTMKLAEIKAMELPDAGCLFLWATVPLLPEAFEVLAAWGYRYKTMLTWNKINGHGMGYWFRGHTEHLLLGVRADIKAFRSTRRNIVECKVGRHSAKPEQFYEIIEEVCPPPRLELFARRQRAGWDTFGNEVERDLLSGAVAPAPQKYNGAHERPAE